MRPRHLLLLFIFVLYLLLAALFAVRTPAWQAPDEPAHYNYIRFVAMTGGFPVLQMGDYPHGYLEEIKSRKFPAELSIDPIRYEFHQPPLYYALLAPVYSLTRGALAPLRLCSVLLGAGVVWLAYAIARRLAPRRVDLALATAAFVAFLPQHLATVSQVGNDVLAGLLFALALYVLIGWTLRPEHAGGRMSLALGILLGLILITKTTAYIAVVLAGGVLIWRWQRGRAGLRQVALEAALVVGPMLLIALPWYARNLATYGWPDFLGLIRHDQIVVGQTRTGEFLAQVGWAAYLRRAIEFTFKSFWGVFGWLGVFMDSRIYFALALLSGLAVAGALARLTGHAARLTFDAPRRRVSLLLLLSVLLTLLTYVWYNTQFVQHQGRYLFTALIPLAFAFAIGWEAVVSARVGRYLAVGLGALAIVLAAWGMVSHTGLPKWPLAITLAFAAGAAIFDFGPLAIERLSGRPLPVLRRLLFALPFGSLPLLSLYALLRFIVPQLAR
ncbi:MAG: glycosyltransferase family 39 protein [Anaerolineae bacterium]